MKGHLRVNKDTKMELKILEGIDEERGCCECQSEECNQQKGGYIKLSARTAGPNMEEKSEFE